VPLPARPRSGNPRASTAAPDLEVFVRSSARGSSERSGSSPQRLIRSSMRRPPLLVPCEQLFAHQQHVGCNLRAGAIFSGTGTSRRPMLTMGLGALLGESQPSARSLTSRLRETRRFLLEDGDKKPSSWRARCRRERLRVESGSRMSADTIAPARLSSAIPRVVSRCSPAQ